MRQVYEWCYRLTEDIDISFEKDQCHNEQKKNARHLFSYTNSSGTGCHSQHDYDQFFKNNMHHGGSVQICV